MIQHPSSPPPNQTPVARFGPPKGLSEDELKVWEMQAPHAFDARTLTPATALAFVRYCKVVVLEQGEAKSSAMGGTNHRGLLKQINAYELQFMLVPCGKPLPAPAAPAVAQDEDDAFFGGATGGSRHG